MSSTISYMYYFEHISTVYVISRVALSILLQGPSHKGSGLTVNMLVHVGALMGAETMYDLGQQARGQATETQADCPQTL